MSTADPKTNLRVGLTILSLVEGDITEMDVDAIVNAANDQLQLGSGVAGAIRRKGGAAIQLECDRHGPIAVGEAAMTTGGELLARHVIHAVGPQMGEGDEDRKLAQATESALRVASGAHLTSIAFPAISTGVFGFPRDRCARIMLDTVVGFVETQKTTLRSVDFCLFDRATFDLFLQELERHRLSHKA